MASRRRTTRRIISPAPKAWLMITAAVSTSRLLWLMIVLTVQHC